MLAAQLSRFKFHFFCHSSGLGRKNFFFTPVPTYCRRHTSTNHIRGGESLENSHICHLRDYPCSNTNYFWETISDISIWVSWGLSKGCKSSYVIAWFMQGTETSQNTPKKCSTQPLRPAEINPYSFTCTCAKHAIFTPWERKTNQKPTLPLDSEAEATLFHIHTTMCLVDKATHSKKKSLKTEIASRKHEGRESYSRTHHFTADLVIF